MVQRALGSNDIRWDDMLFPVITGRLRGVADPVIEKLADNGAGSDGVFGVNFVHTGVKEILIFGQVPHKWKIGTDIKFHVHWKKTTDASGTVVWGLEYWGSKPLSDMPANSTVITQTSGITGTDSAARHEICEFAAVIPAAYVAGISSCFVMRMFRDTDDAADTYANKATALYADFHYQKDDRGSIQEWVK